MSVGKYNTNPDANLTVGDGGQAVGIQEGMPRGMVNDAMRAMAADLAKWHRDLGSLITSGSSSAFTVQSSSDITAYSNGLMLILRFHTSCAADATLNLNGLGARRIRIVSVSGAWENVREGHFPNGAIALLVNFLGEWHVVGGRSTPGAGQGLTLNAGNFAVNPGTGFAFQSGQLVFRPNYFPDVLSADFPNIRFLISSAAEGAAAGQGYRFTPQQARAALNVPQSTATVTAGVGLIGGGQIGNNPQINLNLGGLPLVSAADVAGVSPDLRAVVHVPEAPNNQVRMNPTQFKIAFGIANTDTAITAGDGLTGGGTIGANRTIALATPSTISVDSVNGVTANGHTHTLSLSGRSVLAGEGLDGGGNLGADRTLNLNIGNLPYSLDPPNRVVVQDNAGLSQYRTSPAVLMGATPIAAVMNKIVEASVGAIGTYALLRYNADADTAQTAGFTTAGSNLRYANVNHDGNSGGFASSPVPAGTWRLHGVIGYYVGNANPGSNTRISLWQRIS